jgi:hypothetical protein
VADVARVFVTGAAGSGKTTLAPRFGPPVYEMDRGEAPDDLDGEWVVEGVYTWDIEKYLTRADVIVWLDLPMRTTIPRILRRHVTLSARGRNPHKGLRLLWHFLRAHPDYYRGPLKIAEHAEDWDSVRRAATEHALAPHMDRVVHLATTREVRWFSRSL